MPNDRKINSRMGSPGCIVTCLGNQVILTEKKYKKTQLTKTPNKKQIKINML